MYLQLFVPHASEKGYVEFPQLLGGAEVEAIFKVFLHFGAHVEEVLEVIFPKHEEEAKLLRRAGCRPRGTLHQCRLPKHLPLFQVDDRRINALLHHRHAHDAAREDVKRVTRVTFLYYDFARLVNRELEEVLETLEHDRTHGFEEGQVVDLIPHVVGA